MNGALVLRKDRVAVALAIVDRLEQRLVKRELVGMTIWTDTLRSVLKRDAKRPAGHERRAA